MKPDELEEGARYVVTGYGEPVELHRVYPKRVIDPEAVGGLRVEGYDVRGWTRSGAKAYATVGDVVAPVPLKACNWCEKQIDSDLAVCPGCGSELKLDAAGLLLAEQLAKAGRGEAPEAT